GRASPAATRPSRLESGSGTSWATGRPRSVTVITSPAAARATTSDAFCLSARMPTSVMCYIVELLPGGWFGTGRRPHESDEAKDGASAAHLIAAGGLAPG